MPGEGVSRSNDNSPLIRSKISKPPTIAVANDVRAETRRQEAESALDSVPSEETAVGLKSFVNKEGNPQSGTLQGDSDVRTVVHH